MICLVCSPFIQQFQFGCFMNQGYNNLTVSTFTVQDDLISETSLNTTFVKPLGFKPKPFTRDFGPKGADGLNSYEQRPIPAIQKRIIQQAHNDAYRELNNDLFNPFEHKLHQGFFSKQGDLYQREKQRQIESIKKKQMELLNSSRNYTIIINNKPQGRSLKVAANNILNEQNVPAISDYYNKKFPKKILEEVLEEDEEQKKKTKPTSEKNNPKNTKLLNKKEDQKSQQVKIEKIVKSANGWKRQSTSEKQIDQLQTPKTVERRQSQGSYQPTIPKNPVRRQVLKQMPKPLPKQNNYQPSSKPPVPTKASKDKSNSLAKNKNTTKKKFSQVYDGPDRNLVQQLEKQISQSPNITFEDIAELQTAKGLLQEAVLLPRMMPEFFKGIRKATRGILLFGPPGTGKTLLAKAVASNNMFFNVSASSLASKWKGESQKMVRILFQMARYYAPSVIFFDQIDSIATKRSQNEHQSTRKVKTELLVQMDGVGSSDASVFVLAATNRPWDLDEALRRRLQKRIYIPLPGKEGRRKMFDIHLKELTVSKKVEWDKVLQLTKGCSGADICNICRDAAYMPMRRRLVQVGGISKIAQLSQTELLNEQISEDDLLQAAKKIKPSVGNEDLKRYSQWMKQFGSS